MGFTFHDLSGDDSSAPSQQAKISLPRSEFVYRAIRTELLIGLASFSCEVQHWWMPRAPTRVFLTISTPTARFCGPWASAHA